MILNIVNENSNKSILYKIQIFSDRFDSCLQYSRPNLSYSIDNIILLTCRFRSSVSFHAGWNSNIIIREDLNPHVQIFVERTSMKTQTWERCKKIYNYLKKSVMWSVIEIVHGSCPFYFDHPKCNPGNLIILLISLFSFLQIFPTYTIIIVIEWIFSNHDTYH